MLPKIRKNRKAYFGIVCLCILSAVLYWQLAGEQQAEKASSEPMRVRFYVVQPVAGDNGREYTGIVRSYYEAKLAFQTAGKIVSREVERGQLVHSGDVLALLDTRDLDQAVSNAEAQVSSAQAQLDLAEKNIQRYNYLLSVGAVSQEIYDQYVQQYAAASALVEQGKAQAAQSRNQLGYSRLVADRDGVVVSLQAEPGQYVAAGESVVTLADAGALEAEFAVPERDMGKIHVQDNVQIRFWALSDQVMPAVIREISQMADADTQTFKVRAALTSVPPELKLGMSAAVSLNSAESGNLCVPFAAVFEHDGKNGVWLEQDGKVHFTPVVLGNPSGQQVEVLEGIHAGDRIIAAGVEKLQEGAMVKGEDF